MVNEDLDKIDTVIFVPTIGPLSGGLLKLLIPSGRVILKIPNASNAGLASLPAKNLSETLSKMNKVKSLFSIWRNCIFEPICKNELRPRPNDIGYQYLNGDLDYFPGHLGTSTFGFTLNLRSVLASFPSRGELSQRPSRLSKPGPRQSVGLLSAVLWGVLRR